MKNAIAVITLLVMTFGMAGNAGAVNTNEKKEQILQEKINRLKDPQKSAKVMQIVKKLCTRREKNMADAEKQLKHIKEMIIRTEVKLQKSKLGEPEKKAIQAKIVEASKALKGAEAEIAKYKTKNCEVEITGNSDTLKSELTIAVEAAENEWKGVNSQIQQAGKAIVEAARSLSPKKEIKD